MEKDLPGYGKPIIATTRGQSFSNALIQGTFENGWRPDLLTVREYTMMDMMDRMSDKIHWESKVFDKSITAKWKAEFMANSDMDVSEKMFDESIAELKYKAKLFETTNSIEALNGVFKSDTIISEDVRLALIEAVKPLEDVPEDQRDWHPGSGGKVLDLIHPSIYPLVYGQTAILPDEYTSLENWFRYFSIGNELQANQDLGDSKQWSNRFQWLPAEVDIAKGNTKFVSYVNNLHPQMHLGLYSIIEQVIDKSIVLWNQTLSGPSFGDPLPRIELNNNGYGEAENTEPEDSEGSDYGVYDEKYRVWQDSRPIVQPEPRTFSPPQDDVRGSHSYDLRSSRDVPKCRIQVIVKIASICLTPDSPTYDGGSWHVEGAANERICASAIYYYDSDNISESFLSFRHCVEGEQEIKNYEQDDHRAMETIYGFKNRDPLIQTLGHTSTRQGRLIAFPNTKQHQVSPFQLDDPSRPGHRKILALFLVDPYQQIISTADVPPQQAEWWEEHIRLIDHIHSNLPQELRNQVMKDLRMPVTMEVAKQQRLELMQERSSFTKDPHHSLESTWEIFNLCEH